MRIVGDLAFYPDRLLVGMRRQTHGENAREQGLVVGANITGKKRQRYEQIPYFWTEMFELKFDFIGDFNVPAGRVQLTGSYAKGRFALRYFQGEKLRGIVLCHHGPNDVQSARTELRQALGK